MSELTPGEHLATIADYGISTTKTGKPQAFVKFKIEGAGMITWFGMFKKNDGTVNDNTFKSLIICGFQGSDVSLLSGGIGSNILNEEKEVKLVLENDTYQGKTFLRVKWINDPNYSTQQKLDRAGAVQVMGNPNEFAGDLIRLRQGMGTANEPKNNVASNEPKPEGYDVGSDAPF